MTDDQIAKFSDQMIGYIVLIGVTYEEVLSFMTGCTSRPIPTTRAAAKVTLNIVTVPVTLIFPEISQYTVLVLNHSYFFLQDNVYKNIHSWVSPIDPHIFINAANKTSFDFKTIDDHKFPSFKAPSIRGNKLAGDTFIEDFDRSFGSNTMPRYVESVSLCISNIQWSVAL